MPKTIFTTVTPLPAGVSREIVLETFHSHTEMIDLNPAHTERHLIGAPPEASPEEYHATWYQITDKISYFPGYKGNVSFKACFHDLANGLQTHCYAPMGLDIKEKWTIGGNAPGEPVQPAEIGIGAPVSGLYIREDVELKCNFLMTRFVRKTLKDCLATLVARLLVKAQLQEAAEANKRIEYGYPGTPPMSPPLSPPLSSAGLDMRFPQQLMRPERFSTQSAISEMGAGHRNEKSPGYPAYPAYPAYQAHPSDHPGHYSVPAELPS